jgi:thioredoxin 2
MNGDGIIVRCPGCGAKNRIPKERWGGRGVCGKCRAPLATARLYPDRLVDIGDATFREEVIDHPGPVVVEFTAPW